MKSRREFLRLVAVGSAAALTTNARGATAAARRAVAKAAVRPAEVKTKAADATAAIPPAVLAEIEKQKKFTADALKTIREYPLPAGSPMAFSFAAARVTRRGGR